jgi:electron transfer flavoprotein beta subunit
VEVVEAPLPLVVTVNGSAAECRPANAKRVMKYKYAACPLELAELSGKWKVESGKMEKMREERPYLNLTQWSVADVDGDPQQCGLSGSPTKVKEVQSISFQAKESKTLSGSDEEINSLIAELLNDKIIG